MIYVERARVSPPSKLGAMKSRGLADLQDFYRVWRKYGRSSKAPSRSRLRRSLPEPQQHVVKPLRKLFNHKCAYCETRIRVRSDHEIDLFRPFSDAADLNSSEIDPEHYWWLAYDWENMYLACSDCNRSKRNLFPLKGTRATIETRYAELAEESPLLLDPCADNPSASLFFEKNGRVRGRDEKGKISIKVYGLNRQALVRARKKVCEEILADLAAWSQHRAKTAVEAHISDEAPFAAVARQIVRRYGLTSVVDQAETLPESAGGKMQPLTVNSKVKGMTKTKREKERERRLDRAASLAESVWIDSVTIQNFKSLRDCSFRFPDVVGGIQGQPGLMLIGRNGVGKSSILQAVAIAACSPSLRRKWLPKAGSFVRREAGKNAEALVRLEFSNGDSLQITSNRDADQFTQEGTRPLGLKLAAYGSTRLPPGHGIKAPESTRRVRVDNLFNPFVPLADAEKWIADVDKVTAREFKLLKEGLAKLLDLGDHGHISRRDKVLYTHLGDGRHPFSQQSDGYRSLTSLATDLMKRLSKTGASMEHAVGTVLLDEIEGHLHPEWKIRIVAMLREVFPSVRFIATTHDPLCLRGLRPGETLLLRRDLATQEPILRQLEVPVGLDSDQLLTGTWFELPTTLDKESERMLEQHRSLLRKSKRTKREEAKMRLLARDLRKRLDSFPGTNMEELVAQIAAKECDEDFRDLSVEDRHALREKIERRLAKAREDRKKKLASD